MAYKSRARDKDTAPTLDDLMGTKHNWQPREKTVSGLDILLKFDNTHLAWQRIKNTKKLGTLCLLLNEW